MKKKKTILVVDDHPLFREGLVSLLSKQKGYEVIADAENGKEGVLKAKDLNPDIILMDISLPDISGIDATCQIRTSNLDTKVVMLSFHSKIDYITDAFNAGASGYITKEVTGEKLLECIDSVVQGEYYLDAAVSQTVVKKLLMLQGSTQKIKDPAYEKLSAREEEVLILISKGFSSKQIAQKLYISPKTVENHRNSIYKKLNIHSTLELIRYAAKYGLIDLELWKE